MIFISQAVIVKDKEGPTDSGLLDEAIAIAAEQKVGPNLVPLISLAAEKVDTGTLSDRHPYHVVDSSHRVHHPLA